MGEERRSKRGSVSEELGILSFLLLDIDVLGDVIWSLDGYCGALPANAVAGLWIVKDQIPARLYPDAQGGREMQKDLATLSQKMKEKSVRECELLGGGWFFG